MEGLIGMIKLYMVENPPPGWMLCTGESLAKADYPELFDLIEYRFGGEGEQFSLPNLAKEPAGHYVIRVSASAEEAANFRGMVSQMVLYAGTNLPTDWLLCDGSMISSEEYPLLAKLMGGRFGVDEKGNFALPAMPGANGVVYLICANGVDPSPSDDDDDY